ncbi:unnamed protein product, partial [marine sediment metagenome]
ADMKVIVRREEKPFGAVPPNQAIIVFIGDSDLRH